MLQERLENIKKYFQSMECAEGKWYINVKYEPKWTAYDSSDGSIVVYAEEKNPGSYWYYGKTTEQSIDSIVDLIEETIETNLEAIRKVELFKSKVEELKALFSDESITYKELETLTFSTSKKEIPPVLKNIKAKKEEKSTVRAKTSIKKEVSKTKNREVAAEHVKATEEEPISKKDMAISEDINERKVSSINNTNQVTANEMSEEEINALRG